MPKKINNFIFVLLSYLVIRFISKFLNGNSNDLPKICKSFIVIVITMSVLFLYDLILELIAIRFAGKYFKQAKKNIANKDIFQSLKCISKCYKINVICYYLRLHWVNYSSGKINNIYLFVRYSNFKYKIDRLKTIILFPPILISVISVFVLEDNDKRSYLISIIKKLVETNFVEFEVKDAWNYIEKIPLLISIFPVFLIFYFIGNRNRVKSIFYKKDNANRERVINNIFELESQLDVCLFTISENMEKLIEKQSYIIDTYLQNKIENYYEFTNKNVMGPIDLENIFEEIEGVNDIEKTVKALFCENNIKYYEEFSSYNHRFTALYNALFFEYDFYKKNQKSSSSLYMLLNPYKSINDNFLTVKHSNKKKVTRSEYEQIRSEIEDSFSSQIYEALTILLYIGLFVDEFKRFVRNGTTETIIKEVVEKNK